jgi:membrane-bound ClpP family serine protease
VELVALSILVVIAVGVAVGVHTGPHGLLAAGLLGIVASMAFVIGVVELVPAHSRPAVAWFLLAGTAVVSAAALVAGAVALPALRRRPPVGPGRLWGADGVAVTDLTPVGTVKVRGETWTAESMCGRLPAGAPVEVMEVDGLRLRVWSEAAVGDGNDPRDEERA